MKSLIFLFSLISATYISAGGGVFDDVPTGSTCDQYHYETILTCDMADGKIVDFYTIKCVGGSFSENRITVYSNDLEELVTAEDRITWDYSYDDENWINLRNHNWATRFQPYKMSVNIKRNSFEGFISVIYDKSKPWPYQHEDIEGSITCR